MAAKEVNNVVTLTHSDALLLPNAVIAGAPKCATTSLYDYLAMHPQVCVLRKKESFYLMDRENPLCAEDRNYHVHGLSGYAELFSGFDESSHKIRLDCTSYYMYQETAPRVLSEFPFPPHVIFVIRNPTDRVYSFYQFAKNNMSVIDKEVSFLEFVESITNEKSSDRFASLPNLRGAVEHSRYYDYLEKWHNYLPKENIHIFLFEDMVADTSKFMQRMAGILGVDVSFYENADLRKQNETYQVRYQRLHRVQRAMRRHMRGMNRNVLTRAIADLYRRINTKKMKVMLTRSEIETLTMLDSEFEESNKLMEKLYGLDLSAWKKPRG